MAVTGYALSEPRAGAMQRGAVTRLLEDERWLALVLLLPTVVLLGLFIAYPFVEGVDAVGDRRQGRRRRRASSGSHNFAGAGERQHLSGPRSGIRSSIRA